MTKPESEHRTLDIQALTGRRLGPYLSHNDVNRAQIWQWCSAMGDLNPLYLDQDYREISGYELAVAPPAMMQMWTMRDINMTYAPGSTDAPPYEIFDTLSEHGFPSNVAVSYKISFHRYLVEGDRAHHYTTVTEISELKKTGLGEGHFVTERVEYLDQDERLFAEALISYFQYRPSKTSESDAASEASPPPIDTPPTAPENYWKSDFSDQGFGQLSEGEKLPELVIPVTHRLIVGGAAASQDYIPVHHNEPAAKAAALPDIIMNILTTSGLCARYLSDWAGPASRLRSLSFKLMAPNIPGDTMTMQGRVDNLKQVDGENRVTVEFAGRNRPGFHVTGSACLALP